MVGRKLRADFDPAAQSRKELTPGVEVQIDGDAGATILQAKQWAMSGTFDQPGVHERSPSVELPIYKQLACQALGG